MKFYSFIYLQEKLKDAGLRYSRPYLNTLEQSGVLPKPQNYYVSRLTPTFGTLKSRAYTQKELKKCVKIVDKFTQKNNK